MTWLIKLLLSFFGSMAKEATSAVFEQASKPDTVTKDADPLLVSADLDPTDVADIDGLGFGNDLSSYDGLQLG